MAAQQRSTPPATQNGSSDQALAGASSTATAAYRLERDPVGEVRVPAVALYGVQTTRALENFQISNLRMNPALITAYAEIKQAGQGTWRCHHAKRRRNCGGTVA